MVIHGLYVLYDARCGVCSRLRHWVEQQSAFVWYDFLPAGSPRARNLFPALEHDQTPTELIVITDGGEVYVDDAAWILCLWGLRDYRAWSYRLSRAPLRPLTRGAWEFLSSHRHQLSAALRLRSDEELAREFQAAAVPACDRN